MCKQKNVAGSLGFMSSQFLDQHLQLFPAEKQSSLKPQLLLFILFVWKIKSRHIALIH